MSKYKLGTISIDSDGTYWVDWVGEHDGGFGAGNLGSEEIDVLLRIVGNNMLKCDISYKDKVAMIETKNDPEDFKCCPVCKSDKVYYIGEVQTDHNFTHQCGECGHMGDFN